MNAVWGVSFQGSSCERCFQALRSLPPSAWKWGATRLEISSPAPKGNEYVIGRKPAASCLLLHVIYVVVVPFVGVEAACGIDAGPLQALAHFAQLAAWHPTDVE